MLRWSVQGVWSQAGLYRRCVVELVCTGGIVLSCTGSVQGVMLDCPVQGALC